MTLIFVEEKRADGVVYVRAMNMDIAHRAAKYCTFLDAEELFEGIPLEDWIVYLYDMLALGLAHETPPPIAIIRNGKLYCLHLIVPLTLPLEEFKEVTK